MNTHDLSARLLDWYDRHRRDLPWRSLPGETADPYEVWLSEIMLQQTTVAAVKDYFIGFIRRWPRVEDLAASQLDDVLRQWAGLGYYARARNLHKCARMVAREHGGKFPRTVGELQALPGIGPYTAAAIAAIAFDVPIAAVDGNVERVVARLHALEMPLPDAKPQIKSLAGELVPAVRAGDFAQAMMDLGATVCAPRKANCLICPWQDYCKARRLGIAESLPRKRAKPARPIRYGTAFWVERPDGAVLLRRRPEKGLLGGMMEVPSSQWQEDSSGADGAPIDAAWLETGKRVEHTFTHFHLVLEIVRAESCNDVATEGYKWVAIEDLASEALPSVMKKVVSAILGPNVVRRRRSEARR